MRGFVRAEAALEGRFQQFASDASDVMAESVARLRKARGAYAERVVVIADGLEKLTPLREEDRGVMEASVEALFLTHRDLLQIPCHAIYTFRLLNQQRDSVARHLGRPMLWCGERKVLDAPLSPEVIEAHEKRLAEALSACESRLREAGADPYDLPEPPAREVLSQGARKGSGPG